MHERLNRQQVFEIQPALPKALMSIESAVLESGLNRTLVELVKLRASQINGCGFCLNMHSREARELGETQERLDVLAAWREVPWFDQREQAALAWCEALTQLPGGGVDDCLYEHCREVLSEAEITNLTAIVIVINSWNRLVAAMHFVPVGGSDKSGAIR